MALGFEPGSWFKDALAAANDLASKGATLDEIKVEVQKFVPAPPRALRKRGEVTFGVNIVATNADEEANVKSVLVQMGELMRVPTVVSGAVMPDACPAALSAGAIPVGGIVATKDAIHPGWHSADICCSMAVTVFQDDVDPKLVLDAGMTLSHFGPGGRKRGHQFWPEDSLLKRFADNAFMRHVASEAVEHFATQGDGNHFFYVGRVASSGKVALVTHHGSRKPGALLYKQGMQIAERTRQRVSPETPREAAWIEANSKEGEAYWDALQLVREWTKANHLKIHDLVVGELGLAVLDQFWNEHNFVFKKSDGLFYHAKGATPAFDGWAHDATELTLIPLNMAEPILITRGKNAESGLGFSPHGAGRNFSRAVFLRRHETMTKEQLVLQQTQGIDARFFCGVPDLSELPGAYKNAATVRAQINHFGLAEVVDEILPFGAIMAGDWQLPYRAARAKQTARNPAEA